TLKTLQTLGESVWYWGPALPVLFVVFLFVWTWTGRASSFRGSASGTLLTLFPWMRSMIGHFEAANFAQLLAMLVEQQVPYPAAIVLAADSSGDPALARAGRAVAAAV